MSGFLFLALTSFHCNADIALKSASEILGTWKVKYTAPRINAEKRVGNQIWDFRRDGTLVSTAKDKRAKGKFSVTVRYEIKDGVILSNQPGRSRKIKYTVVEKDDNSMILRGGMDGFLFLSKQ